MLQLSGLYHNSLEAFSCLKVQYVMILKIPITYLRDELKSRVDMAAADGRIISDAEENMFRKVCNTTAWEYASSP